MLMNLSGSSKKEGEMVYFGELCLITALPHKQIFPPHTVVCMKLVSHLALLSSACLCNIKKVQKQENKNSKKM